MSRSNSVLKTLLLSSVLATTLIAPSTATAETVNVMVVNMRSEDGVYRPALRVVRGGTVTFFRTDDTEAENPLTVSVIRNQARLMAWLMEAIPQTANETFDINIEVIESTPAEQPAAPTPPVAEPTPPATEPTPPATEPTSTETTTPAPEKETKQPNTGYNGTGYNGTGYNGTGYNGTGYNGTGYPSGNDRVDYTATVSIQFAQASIADMDEAGRLAIYPTV